VIAVASNLIPDQMATMIRLGLEGNFAEANAINDRLAPLFAAEFVETNPIPIKYMLYRAGMCEEIYRLPMCELQPENRTRVDMVLEQLELVPELQFA
jgi:4-hydroxy-tetrahydrodipicolinate synthase